MKYIVAVSGGVDSVVLLHKMVQEAKHELIVAHFDHGIRPDSAADAQFVEALARRYHLPFITKREELGPHASEAYARTRRYLFLRAQAKQHQATIITAHHANDAVETIAINLLRGSGWRGLAVLDSPDITRPLIFTTKREIYNYALKHKLEWVEDSTNAQDIYLRNRVRRHVGKLEGESTQQLLRLQSQQVRLKSKINAELKPFVQPDNRYKRYLFTMQDTAVGSELLRAAVLAAVGNSPTRPQLERALIAIKTAQVGTTFELGKGAKLQFTADMFIVFTS